MSDDDIRKALKGLKDATPDYPDELRHGTRDEFRFNVARKTKKKDGCRDQGAMMILLVQLIIIISLIL